MGWVGGGSSEWSDIDISGVIHNVISGRYME